MTCVARLILMSCFTGAADRASNRRRASASVVMGSHSPRMIRTGAVTFAGSYGRLPAQASAASASRPDGKRTLAGERELLVGSVAT